MTRSRRLRLLLLCAASALASASLPAAADELADAAHAESGAAADGQTPRSFDIPAQDLGSALRQFALQSSQQILFSTDIVQGKSTQELKGSFTPDSALAKLLAQSGLASSKSADGSLLISIAGPGETSPPTAAVSEVTVSARRAQLQPRVQEFVVQIAALDGGGGLARWQTPVCPLETGLSRRLASSSSSASRRSRGGLECRSPRSTVGPICLFSSPSTPRGCCNPWRSAIAR